MSDQAGAAAPKIRYRLLLPLALAGLILDQWSKGFVFHLLAEGPRREGLFLFLRAVRNNGAVFGLFPGYGGVILLLGILLFLVFLFLVRNHPMRGSRLFAAGLGLQVAGAAGNVLDRLRLGYVRDFIDLHVWPVFNLADMYIVTGCVLLFLAVGRSRE